MAIKVKLRQKAISGNRQSLYLDFYPAIPHPETGEPTRREFIGMYLFDKSKNLIDKQHNKCTLELAEQIRQKRENHLNKPEIYTGYEKEQLKIKERGEQDFVAYFKALTEKRKSSNFDNWISAFYYLETYTNGHLKFNELSVQFCNAFREYLLTTKSRKRKEVSLSQNSALSYFNKLKVALKQAHKDGILANHLNSKVEGIKQVETRKVALTIEELNTLIRTECLNPLLKKAALFSALTGLRFSDIQKLAWHEIEFIKGNGYFLRYRQQKTQAIEMAPISEQAFLLLGKKQSLITHVFEGYHQGYLYRLV